MRLVVMSAILPVQSIISIRITSEIDFVDSLSPGCPAGPLIDELLPFRLIFSMSDFQKINIIILPSVGLAG
jgi:hypothetical protein